jgi:hypothetical protein
MALIKVPKEVLQRVWVCYVTRIGMHSGAGCCVEEPHGEYWECGWYYERRIHLSEAQYKQCKYVTLETSDETD